MPEYLTSLLRRPPVGWWDLLDIAIVSILIYEFLKLIRGTRAVQMAVGSLLIIMSRALFVGLDRSVRDYLAALES